MGGDQKIKTQQPTTDMTLGNPFASVNSGTPAVLPVPEVEVDFTKKGLGGGNVDGFREEEKTENLKTQLQKKQKPSTVQPKPVVPEIKTPDLSATNIFSAGKSSFSVEKPSILGLGNNPMPAGDFFSMSGEKSDKDILAWAQKNPEIAETKTPSGTENQPQILTNVFSTGNISSAATGSIGGIDTTQAFDISNLTLADNINPETLASIKDALFNSNDPAILTFKENYSIGLDNAIKSGNGDRNSSVNNVIEYQQNIYSIASNTDDENSLINNVIKNIKTSDNPQISGLSENDTLLYANQVVRDMCDDQYVESHQKAIESGDNETVVVLTEGAAHEDVISDDKKRLTVEVTGLDAVDENDKQEVADHIAENDQHEIDESNEEMKNLHEQQVQQMVSHASESRLALFIARNADHSELIERASNKVLAQTEDPDKRAMLKDKVDKAIKDAKTDEVKAQVQKKADTKPSSEKPANQGVMTGRTPEKKSAAGDPNTPFGEVGKSDETQQNQKQVEAVAEQRRLAEEFMERQKASTTPVTVKSPLNASPQMAAKKLENELTDPDTTYSQKQKTVNDLNQKDTFYRINVYIKSSDPQARKFLIENNIISMGEIAEYFEKFPQELRLAPQSIQDDVKEYYEKHDPEQKTQESANI